MASVYVGDDDAPFIITETASEAAAIVVAALSAGRTFATLTLGNESEWNAKPLYVRAEAVMAISPPKNHGDEERE
jgi:hypothetical protein